MAQAGSASLSASNEQTRDVISDQEIKEVWKRMGSMYGHKWTTNYGEKIDPLWARAMKAIPLNRLQIALARCGHRDDAWPPSLPEFIELTKVRADEVGASDPEAAYSEACRGAYPYNAWHRWSNKCVYWAAVWTGMSDINERPKASRKEFMAQYQKAVEIEYRARVDGSEGLANPPSAKLESRPDPSNAEADREASLKIIDSLKTGAYEGGDLVYVAGHGLLSKEQAERL